MNYKDLKVGDKISLKIVGNWYNGEIIYVSGEGEILFATKDINFRGHSGAVIKEAYDIAIKKGYINKCMWLADNIKFKIIEINEENKVDIKEEKKETNKNNLVAYGIKKIYINREKKTVAVKINSKIYKAKKHDGKKFDKWDIFLTFCVACAKSMFDYKFVDGFIKQCEDNKDNEFSIDVDTKLPF